LGDASSDGEQGGGLSDVTSAGDAGSPDAWEGSSVPTDAIAPGPDAPEGGETGTAVDGGTCSNGPCRVIATGQPFPRAVAVDSTSIYWVNEGTEPKDEVDGALMKASLDGGAPVVLAADQPFALSIAVDDVNVYWVSQDGANGAKVQKVPLQGGTPVVLATGVLDASGLAVDGSNVYYQFLAGGFIMAVPIAGGTPVTLNTLGGSPVIDSTSLYFATTDRNAALTGVAGNHLLVSMPRAGGALTVLTSSSDAQLGQVTSLAVGSTNLYWGDNDKQTIETLPVHGGTRSTLATKQQTPFGMAVDAVNLYWSTASAVMELPLAGGTPRAIATGQDNPWGIAIDATTVYWADYSGGQIRATSK
jgi:hypothetical protein